jgi:hypothetical protein
VAVKEHGAVGAEAATGVDLWEFGQVWDDLPTAQLAIERTFPRKWAERNLLTEKGQPLDFNARHWQRQMWDDTHPRQVSQKPSQIGETLRHVVHTLHKASVLGKTCIYTMPTDGEAAKLVTGRVDRIIDSSPYLREKAGRAGSQGRRKPTDNTEQKQFGVGTIYFDGCRGRVGALSIPADATYHDEVDFSDPETLEMFRKRLNALPVEAREAHYFSTPTVDNWGINKLWRESDARRWLVRCAACSWWGPLDYWEQTEGHLLYLKCPNSRCGKPLDPTLGEWVAQHPGRSGDVHGYELVRVMLALPGQPQFLASLHEERQRSIYPWHFDNMELGVTSKAGTSSIDVERVKRVAFTEPYGRAEGAELGAGGYFMGVDQGGTLTVLVGRADPKREGFDEEGKPRIRVLWQGRLAEAQKEEEAWDRLPELMERFRVELCVVDANPDGAMSHRFARRFPGRVLCCYYKEGQRTEVQTPSDVERRAQGEVRGSVQTTERVDISVERTESLDNTAKAVQNGGFLLPGSPSDLENREFLAHLAANVSRPQLSEDGVVYRWERTGTNDYFHALNYLRVAMQEGTRLGAQQPRRVAPPVVLGATPKGMSNGRKGNSSRR